MTSPIQRPVAGFLAATFVSLSLASASLAHAQQAGTQAGSGAALPMRD